MRSRTDRRAPQRSDTRRDAILDSLEISLRETTFDDINLADLAVDELMEMTGIEEERAKALITTARAHWFADEQQ